MSKYDTFKISAAFAGGIVCATAVTYFTTIYLPARIIGTAITATTAAMNASLGPFSGWLSGTVADTAAIAGAEAYGAVKSTGLVGASTSTILGSAAIGYAFGSKAVEYTLDGMEKVYNAFFSNESANAKSSSGQAKTDDEKSTNSSVSSESADAKSSSWLDQVHNNARERSRSV